MDKYIFFIHVSVDGHLGWYYLFVLNGVDHDRLETFQHSFAKSVW